MFARLTSAIGNRLAAYLTKSMSGYVRLDTVPIDKVYAVLRPGDVVLVEGNTRISVAIKYLTQSSWSHSALFVGPEGAELDAPSLLEAGQSEIL